MKDEDEDEDDVKKLRQQQQVFTLPPLFLGEKSAVSLPVQVDGGGKWSWK